MGTGSNRDKKVKCWQPTSQDNLQRDQFVLLQKMAAGETGPELLRPYPQLTEADLQSVLEYAARAAAEEIVLAES